MRDHALDLNGFPHRRLGKPMHPRLVLVAHGHMQGQIKGRTQAQLLQSHLSGAFTFYRRVRDGFAGDHGTIVPSHAGLIDLAPYKYPPP